MDESDNIVVVGGGTAGWLSALFAKKTFPHKSVILIESEKIGILGAGEGTTPLIIDICSFLNISLFDFIKQTKSTIKNGLQFNNWSQKNKKYYHTFENIYKILNNNPYYSYSDFFNESIISNNNPYLKNFTAQLSEKNKVPFLENDLENVNYRHRFNALGAAYAIHFDARLLAEFLKKIGIERGIKRVEGIVVEAHRDEQGYIKSLTLDNKMFIDTSFVIDCSGFHRYFIQKVFNGKWSSFSHFLPSKKAYVFFMDREAEIKPYTEVNAMSYGWEWRIPLQHRFGCGYVVDSDFISDDNAKEEIDNKHGKKIEIVNTFKINPGCFEEVWVKNCLALGLASAFVEPLEATSIMQLTNNLLNFFSHPSNIKEKNQNILDEFNHRNFVENKEIAEFIYLHYITDKTNTEFWQNFTKNYPAPENIKNILEINKYRIINSYDLKNNNIFFIDNFISIMFGNNIISEQAINRSLLNRNFKEQEYINALKNFDININNSVNHNHFINNILK